MEIPENLENEAKNKELADNGRKLEEIFSENEIDLLVGVLQKYIEDNEKKGFINLNKTPFALHKKIREMLGVWARIRIDNPEQK